MKKWACSVCGYVHAGDAAPENCPQCKAPSAKFREQTAAGGYAAEHTIPVYNIDVSIQWDKKTPEYIRLDDGTNINYSLKDSWLSFTVPKLDVHNLVIIDRGNI